MKARPARAGVFAAGMAPLFGLAGSLSGQQTSAPAAGSPASRYTAKLGTMTVAATRGSGARLTVLQSLTLPAIATVTAKQIDQTVNVVDPEDAAKYLPSLFLRKPNYGDTQATCRRESGA